MSGYMLRVAPNRGVACCAAVKKTAAEVLEMKERRRAREALKEERKRQQARETCMQRARSKMATRGTCNIHQPAAYHMTAEEGWVPVWFSNAF